MALKLTAMDNLITVDDYPVAPVENPAAVHLAAQSARARPGVLSSLRTACRILSGGTTEDPLLVDWSKLRYQHLAALLAYLSDEGRKPAGIAHIRNCVLGVMRAAWRLEMIDADASHAIQLLPAFEDTVVARDNHPGVAAPGPS